MKPRGWFSHPVLSALIAATWLLLQGSLAPPQLLSAAVLGLVLPHLLHGFVEHPARLRGASSLAPALRLLGTVLWDIVSANLTVAWLVLRPAAQPRPAWVVVPLSVSQPAAVDLLASIVSITPGTVSCVVDLEHRRILVHVLDGAEAHQVAAGIKSRYERPLLEIFA